MKRLAAKVDLVTPGFTDISEPGEYMIKASNLSAGYGSRIVLSNVSIGIRPGEMVGLVGSNGSGKSTLLHCMTGFHNLKSGHVSANGKLLHKLSRQQIARTIAFLPQHTEAIFGFSVLEMVLMGRHPYAGFAARDSKADIEIARKSLADLSVEHLAGNLFTELSGGEQQLVLLARCFAQETPCLMLDEPLSGLDMAHQFIFLRSLAKAADSGKAVLGTYHDLALAARWCDRIILLGKGSVLADGSPEEVLTAENLSECYGVKARVVVTGGMDHAAIEVVGVNSKS